MQTIESPDLLKVTESASSGVRSLQLSRMAIGMVTRGEMLIYHNDHSTTIAAGEVYLLQPGIHYVEHRPKDGCFEHILSVNRFVATDNSQSINILRCKCAE